MSIETKRLVREILRRNPDARQSDIARVLGISRQAVHQMITSARASNSEDSYRLTADYVRRTISERGKIWEAVRPYFEADTDRCGEIDRLIRERVMVPASDPNGGYVLPGSTRAERAKDGTPDNLELVRVVK